MDFGTIENLMPLAIAMIPALVSIFMQVFALLKILKGFGVVKESYEQDIDALQKQVTLLMKENIELRKKFNELLTQIDHVERK